MSRRALGTSHAGRLALALVVVAALVAASGCRHELSAARDGAAERDLPGDSSPDAPGDGPLRDTADSGAGDARATDGSTDSGRADIARADGAAVAADTGAADTTASSDGSADSGCNPAPVRLASPTSCAGAGMVGGEATCAVNQRWLTRFMPTAGGQLWQASCSSGSVTVHSRCLAVVPAVTPSTGSSTLSLKDVTCLPNHTAIAGGCECTGGALRLSYPAFISKGRPTGWSCACAAGGVTTRVLCVPDASLGCLRVSVASSTAGDPSTATCPVGRVPLSGGCYSNLVIYGLTVSGRDFRCAGENVVGTKAVCVGP